MVVVTVLGVVFSIGSPLGLLFLMSGNTKNPEEK
jgi:hypothetical protein